jgi:hypothetical protein
VILRAARPVAAGASVLVASALCVQAWRLASADSIVSDVNVVIDGPSWRKAAPPLEPWLQIRNDLLEAQRLTPSNPAVLEGLGILHARRTPSPEFLTYARDYLWESLQLRPTSPYTWANYAATKYLVGERGPSFERALVTATTLGPWEPEVHRVVTDVGLAVLDEVSPQTRSAIERNVALSMKRNPLETLEISQRRGRLDLACRLSEAKQRATDPKWVSPCEKGTRK